MLGEVAVDALGIFGVREYVLHPRIALEPEHGHFPHTGEYSPVAEEPEVPACSIGGQVDLGLQHVAVDPPTEDGEAAFAALVQDQAGDAVGIQRISRD